MPDHLPWLAPHLEQLERDGLLRRRRQTRWLANGECEIDGRRAANFIANDSLNLASDPRVIAAAEQALHETGVGARASALLGGRTDWHVRLEQRLAAFEGQPAAILFPTGFAANLGTLSALITDRDVVFSDRLNHASLIDGCRMSKAKLRIYRHDDLETLDRELASVRVRSPRPRFGGEGQGEGASASIDSHSPRLWIVTDGVFSMDGDLAPLAELCDLAERHAAAVIVDEAHATGVWGTLGRGVAEHCGVEERVAVRIGTLSKAIGALGGFVTGPQPLIDFLWNSARAQVFSTALPPAVCAAAEQAVAIIQQEPERRALLHRRSMFLRERLAERGVAVLAGSQGPIVPIVLNDPRRAVELADRLEQRGFLVGAIRPPTVPAGTSRLRISLTIAHEEDRLESLATAVAEEASRG